MIDTCCSSNDQRIKLWETEQQQEKIEKRKDDYWLYLYVHCPNPFVQDWFLNDVWI